MCALREVRGIMTTSRHDVMMSASRTLLLTIVNAECCSATSRLRHSLDVCIDGTSILTRDHVRAGLQLRGTGQRSFREKRSCFYLSVCIQMNFKSHSGLNMLSNVSFKFKRQGKLSAKNGNSPLKHRTLWCQTWDPVYHDTAVHVADDIQVIISRRWLQSADAAAGSCFAFRRPPRTSCRDSTFAAVGPIIWNSL